MEKEKILNHLKALEKYNKWEQTVSVSLDRDSRIAMVGNLYELIPFQNRAKELDVMGIVKMRQALSLLQNH